MKKSDKTREMIIRKAAHLFNQKGYHGTSMSDIMDATGLTKGGIYGNFKKNGNSKKGVKQEIAVEAFNYAVKAVQKEVGKRTHVIENNIDKLKAVVYFYREYIFNPTVEGGCPILNTSIEADDNNPDLRKLVIKALNYWEGRIICTLERGIDAGEVRPEVNKEEFASQFIAVLEGGIMVARVKNTIQPFLATSKLLLQMIDDIRI